MGQTQVSSRTTVKRAIIDGRIVDLYGAARAYLILVIGIVLGFAMPLAALLAAQSIRSPTNVIVLFLVLQSVAAGMIGWGMYCSGRARGNSKILYTLTFVVGTVLAMVPILGLLPAASDSAAIHALMNKVGVPVGALGPRPRDIAKLRHGECHQCGYDLTLLASERCPECNADIRGEKPTKDGILALLTVSPAEAAPHLKRCRQVAVAGLVVCGLQWAVHLLLTSGTGYSFVAVFLIPGLIFGAIAGSVTLGAQSVLREEGRVDFVGVSFVGLLFPPLTGVLINEIVGRLQTAANRETQEAPGSQPPNHEAVVQQPKPPA